MNHRGPAAQVRLLRSKVAALEELLSVQERTVAQQSGKLVSAREEAMAATRAKSEFLANMSHELRTPLNSVIGFSNILLKNKSGTLRPEQLTYLERILDNGKHLLELINSVLDLSKIEAGKTALELSRVSIHDLVQGTVSQLQDQVQGRDVSLIAECPEDAVPIETDRRKLKQVLINLVGNALRFTKRGSVTLRVGMEPESGLPTRIEVIDTGIGIPPDKMARVFEAFEQADASTSREFGGTGLGLAISKSLCDLMGCRLEVESEVGRGSTFRIVLPAHAAAKPAEPAAVGTVTEPALPVAAREPAPRDLTALVIDDEADSRLLLTQHLEELVDHVIAVGSGEEGLRLARARKPDLITLDLMMPGMDGWHVLRELKADPELRRIPVVVVSIVAGDEIGSVFGAVDLLNKPVSREELSSVLSRCFQSHTRTALVVDDDEDTRELLKHYLEEEGLKVRMADGGAAALEILNDFLPDLITLDLLMPEMDGLTFLERIRQDERYLQIPVVVVSARELSAGETRQLSTRVRAILQKSGEVADDLKKVVRSMLG